MTALIVIGCIMLFFAVLLLSPVILIFSYRDGKMTAKLWYLFIVIDFSPEKLAKRAEKKSKKAVKKEYKKQEAEEEPSPQKKEKAAIDTVKTAWSYVKASKKGLDILRNHLVFYKIRGAIIVGGEDAAKTAQNYVTYSTIAANGLTVLDLIFVVKEPDIQIKPDFLSEQTLLELGARARISPLFPVLAGISILVGILKVMHKNKRKREKIKGGKKNGRNERIKRTKQREHAASHQ